MLLCNRDERRTRKPGMGPRIGSVRGVSFIAPIDGDHGGSWIGVNQFGLTLCLLNRYVDSYSEPDRSYTSRGLLLVELLDSEQAQQVGNRFGEIQLDRFQPFTLLALSSDARQISIDWTGQECEIRSTSEAFIPITSTSLRESAIAVTRRDVFEALKSEAREVSAEMLCQFHRSHVPERGAYSVCMHREDAATVSMSKVTVSRDAVEFVYHPTSPCIEAPAETVVIERRPIFSQAAAL
jgi:hypothetical protein